jgi:hypothetical protein
MPSDGVVVPSPPLDDDLRFVECVEDFTIQKFIPQFRVKLSQEPFSQGLPGMMYGRPGADSRDPVA